MALKACEIKPRETMLGCEEIFGEVKWRHSVLHGHVTHTGPKTKSLFPVHP